MDAAGLYGSSCPSMTIVLPMRASVPKSFATRRIVSDGTPEIFDACSGVYFFTWLRNISRDVLHVCPSTSNLPKIAGFVAVLLLNGSPLFDVGFQTSGTPLRLSLA